MLTPVSSVFHIFVIGNEGRGLVVKFIKNPTTTRDLPRLRPDFFTKTVLFRLDFLTETAVFRPSAPAFWQK
jgi:hypothetical protein